MLALSRYKGDVGLLTCDMRIQPLDKKERAARSPVKARSPRGVEEGVKGAEAEGVGEVERKESGGNSKPAMGKCT